MRHLEKLIEPKILGPFLTVDNICDGQLHLAALFVAPTDIDVPDIETDTGQFPAQELTTIEHHRVQRARFTRPALARSQYTWAGMQFDVTGVPDTDFRIASASCNGEEQGDMDRDPAERNAMWARFCSHHPTTPFSLLLHGGDQIYADEATKGHRLSEDWPKSVPRDPTRADLDGLRDHLRSRFAARYIALLEDPSYAWIFALVPSLAQWDDHDICDGWGSLPRSRTYSPAGQLLFTVAREMAFLFQHGCIDGDLPARFADPKGRHLGWQVQTGELRLNAPDLRSERTRRDVMGERGWQMMEAAAAALAPAHTFFVSSVPLLGPRLLVFETMMVLIPTMQKYEDDPRDQWQSRAHRDSWKRMLNLAKDMVAQGGDVTAVSGEIHLAAPLEL
ncbi:MAG: alkaline phosphatase D family protein [Roseobacter sp.]